MTGQARVYGLKAKMPSVSGVAGATRTPTPTKTMPSAITGPLPIGPPAWKVKSAAPVLTSRALKKPRLSPAKTSPFAIPTGETEVDASGASHSSAPLNASSATATPVR